MPVRIAHQADQATVLIPVQPALRSGSRWCRGQLGGATQCRSSASGAYAAMRAAAKLFTASCGSSNVCCRFRHASIMARFAGVDILAKCDRRLARIHHEWGPCLVWREGEPRGPDAQSGPYGRMYDAALGKQDRLHTPRGLAALLWADPARPGRRPQMQRGLSERPDHLQLLTKPANTRRRHQHSA
jgi:hypothetical protein